MPVVKPLGVVTLDVVRDGQGMAGIKQTGKIGYEGGFGSIRFGHTNYGSIEQFGGVYQKRVTGYNHRGRIKNRPRRAYYVRMRYYRPTNPRTPRQQTRRAKFAEAVAGWEELTPVEKKFYNHKARGRSLTGYNLYISEKMRNN